MSEQSFFRYYTSAYSVTTFWTMDITQRWKPGVSDPSSREETSSEFEERFSTMASSAYTVLGVALGSRLGLFHKMALMEEPWTPRELAEAGNWKERWVHPIVMCTFWARLLYDWHTFKFCQIKHITNHKRTGFHAISLCFLSISQLDSLITLCSNYLGGRHVHIHMMTPLSVLPGITLTRESIRVCLYLCQVHTRVVGCHGLWWHRGSSPQRGGRPLLPAAAPPWTSDGSDCPHTSTAADRCSGLWRYYCLLF